MEATHNNEVFPMVNFSAFEVVHNKFGRKDAPFLTRLCDEVYSKQPYKGLKILHNIPLTLEAVLKMEPLLLGGAEVTASCITSLPPNEDAVNILKAANIPIQIEHKFDSEYDFALDCCGELVDVIVPKIGAVELTQTGSEIYKNSRCGYPVISIDDSELKYLETLFGTGDGFVRAIRSVGDQEIYDKKFVLFGCGKVGIGIVYALLKFTDNIVVIEKNKSQIELLSRKGIKCIRDTDIDRIKVEIKNAYCVVTATGIKGLVSNFYGLKKENFGNSILTNMGADDEYGDNFHTSHVFFDKKPLNFAISEPTAIKYLDPVLYAHNVSIDLILSQKTTPGYHAFPDDLAQKILVQWSNIYHEMSTLEMKKYLS